LEPRIDLLVNLYIESLDRMNLQSRLNETGKIEMPSLEEK